MPRFIFILICFILLSCSNESKNTIAVDHSTKNTSFKILIGGDFSFGENYQLNLQRRGESNILVDSGYQYCLDSLMPFIDAVDMTVLNLETALTTQLYTPYYGKKTYIHKSNPDSAIHYLNKTKTRLVSLGNNHAFDYGIDGLMETINHLDNAGIHWIGAGGTFEQATRAFSQNIILPEQQLKIEYIAGFWRRGNYVNDYDFYATEEKAGVNMYSLKTEHIHLGHQKAADIQIAFPHFGNSYGNRNENQQKIAERLIDEGADIIIGHGAHRMQEIELYNGKWILYNIGNLLFNSPGRYEKEGSIEYSMIVILDIKSKDDVMIKLYPILSNNLKTNYQPRPLNRDEFERIIKYYRIYSQDIINFGVDELGYHLKFPMFITSN